MIFWFKKLFITYYKNTRFYDYVTTREAIESLKKGQTTMSKQISFFLFKITYAMEMKQRKKKEHKLTNVVFKLH